MRRTLRSVIVHFCAMRRWLGKQKPESSASSASAISTNLGDGDNGTVHAHVMTLTLIGHGARSRAAVSTPRTLLLETVGDGRSSSMEEGYQLEATADYEPSQAEREAARPFPRLCRTPL